MTRNLSCWSAPLFRKLLQVKNSYKVEVVKFEQSKAFLKMMARVSSRVGLQLDNHTLLVGLLDNKVVLDNMELKQVQVEVQLDNPTLLVVPLDNKVVEGWWRGQGCLSC